jgi:hypothetical protein
MADLKLQGARTRGQHVPLVSLVLAVASVGFFLAFLDLHWKVARGIETPPFFTWSFVDGLKIANVVCALLSLIVAIISRILNGGVWSRVALWASLVAIVSIPLTA